MSKTTIAGKRPSNNGCAMHPEYNFTCGTCNNYFNGAEKQEDSLSNIVEDYERAEHNAPSGIVISLKPYLKRAEALMDKVRRETLEDFRVFVFNRHYDGTWDGRGATFNGMVDTELRAYFESKMELAQQNTPKTVSQDKSSKIAKG